MKRMRSAANGAVIINKAAKRPVDKKVITVAKTAIGTTAVTTTLFTAAAPCTLNGLIFSCGSGAVSGPLYWFVIRVDEGDTTNAVSVTDGNASYTPESDILMSGVFPVNTASSPPTNLATTHAKRKLMIGDRIIFVARTASSTANFDGICTMFFKY